MTLEIIELSVNGSRLPFLSCELQASAENAVRQAGFNLAVAGLAGLPCEPDDPAMITISGVLWGTGYVRDVNPSHDGRDHQCRVTFVSRTCDATECSIMHPTGLAKNVDLAGIAQEFDTLGVGVDAQIATDVKRIHKIIPGESLFATIEAEAKAQGVLIYDTPQGKLKLADKPEGRHAGTLAFGVNILSASAQLSGAGSFDAVTVRGQASLGTDAPSLRPEAVAKGAAKRARPLLKMLDGEATSGRLKRRAQWEARRAAGNNVACTVTVAGMRDAGGTIWSPNFLVEVRDALIGIEQDMVTATVTLKQDANGGTTTVLSLKDPRALGGGNPRGKSAVAWAAPEPADAQFRAE